MEGPIKARRFKRRTIRNAALIGGGLLLVVALFFGARFVYYGVLERVEREAREAAQHSAAQVAEAVAAAFKAKSDRLAKLAKEPEIIELLAIGDPAQLAAAAELRRNEFEGALKLRLLRPGDRQLDSESNPPLGFASLDMLNRVERTNETPAAEVHLPETPQAHIVLVQRVEDGQTRLVGFLHLSLSTDQIDRALAAAPQVPGYVEIRQMAGGAPVTLAKRGDARHKRGEAITSAIAGTRWRVEYWPADDAELAQSAIAIAVAAAATPPASGQRHESNGELSTLGVTVAAGLIAMILAGGAFLLLKRHRAPPRPRVVYAGAVKAIMDGAHPGLERLIPNLLSRSAAPVPVSLIPDDETTTQLASVAVGIPEPEALKAETPIITRVVPAAPAPEPAGETLAISPSIFRAYDIRGVVGETLSADAAAMIGRAVGSENRDRGGDTVVVGRDGRKSSPELAAALMEGLREAGNRVIDIGLVPTPVLYYATHHFGTGSGVMVTGSHNPPRYNGFKIVLAGETLSGDAILALCARILEGRYVSGHGDLQKADITADYLRRVTEDIQVASGRALKIVIDAGNGAAGGLAPQVYRALGHKVHELNCEVDGDFPAHLPDPSQSENLEQLIGTVRELRADIGFAFDGDGDRLGVVDGEGRIIWPDRQLMLFSADVLSRNKGAPIIFDVKCSRYLKLVIEQHGGRPVMWRTGHSLIKAKMAEIGAPLAGEMSGHVFFKERWYGFDDGLYAGARLLEILVREHRKPAEIFAELPGGVATPELRIELAEGEHGAVMEAFRERIDLAGGELTEIDGIRIDYPDGFGLLRPSNTTPCLIARFEGDDDQALKRIQATFRAALEAARPAISTPF